MANDDLQALLDKAIQATNNGNYDQAELFATEVLTELDKQTYPSEESHKSALLRADALISLTDSASLRGNYDVALIQGHSVLALAEQNAMFALLPKIKNLIGVVYMRMGNYDKSLELYLQALTAYKETGNKSNVGDVMVNINLIYYNLGKYDESLEYLSQALVMYEELGDKQGLVIAAVNFGNVYYSLGIYDKSLKYYLQALSIIEEPWGKSRGASIFGNIGIVYRSLGMYDLALEYLSKALSVHKELGEISWVAHVTGNIGTVYHSIGAYDKSLENYLQALSAHEELGEDSSVARVTGNIGSLYSEIGLYEKSFEYCIRALSAHEKLGENFYIANDICNIGTLYANQKFEGYNAEQAEEYLLKAIALSKEVGAKQQQYIAHQSLSDLYKTEKRWEECQKHFEYYHDIEKEVQSEEAKKQAQKHDTERRESEREKTLAVERALSKVTNDILANILPPNITERLIKGEKKIANTHENVSVLFVDIVGFTQISRQLPASELIDLLDIVFTRFDVICKKHGLEKIKTIGDAYMAVCGAPISYENHAERTAFAALEMLEDFTIEQKFSVPVNLGFRIGLHTGSVVAGIIGENKYSYDLWGDAVNTASRMESHGEEDKIHVSEEFRNSAGDGFTFTERGEMDIKGKGMMKTYFLENK